MRAGWDGHHTSISFTVIDPIRHSTVNQYHRELPKQIWGVAHRILLPAFSNVGMKQYFHIVQDCVTALFDKVRDNTHLTLTL